ncbi:MAG TPA: DUF2092 domain-containing protein [Thermoanaerobaculia bacterium]|nr:DUF2092 domain-containing protein [Thermoanaerobaculia bacterium]
MPSRRRFPFSLALVLGVGLNGASAEAQTAAAKPAAPQQKEAPKAAVPAPAPAPAPAPRPVVKEPKAVEILKACSAKLAAARTLSFTALGAYEVPSRWGPPLIYGRIYEVTLQRPDKLRVITVADGPVTEFYDDGKTLTSFHPAENLAAVTEAAPTVDASLEKIYKAAGTYFPFTDAIVSDPWKDIEPGLTGAFWVGESRLVGGKLTDVVAYEVNGVFVQMWIGRDDRLPYMSRALYLDDPQALRHSVQFSSWNLNPAVAADAFTSGKAKGAASIPFSTPAAKSDLPAAVKPLGAAERPSSQPAPKQ